MKKLTKKITYKATKEIEISHVCMRLPYDDDDELQTDLLPDAEDGILNLTIEVATGKVCDWKPEAGAMNIWLKPRDSGVYKLFAPDGSLLAEVDEDYVPNGMIPGDYGDYVDLQINADGIVTNWPKPDQISFDDTNWKWVGMEIIRESGE